MKNKLLFNILTLTLFFLPKLNYAQSPPLGLASGFALYTGVGSITNVNIPRTQITGNVGTNAGAVTGFGNINGQVQVTNAITLQCSTDVASAYAYLGSRIPTFFPASSLGNGQTLVAGVYAISGTSTLTLNLNLDAQNNSGAVFVIKISGAFSTAAASSITLLNGAKACNVYWKIDGAVTFATNTSFKGTIVSNSAISMGALSSLEGRALTTVGLISTNGVNVNTPIGCGSAVLLGPPAPNTGTVGCFELFSGIGQLTNPGSSSNIIGKIGADAGGAPTGFGSAPGPLEYNNPVTAQAKTDLTTVYNSLKAGTLPFDIELLFPAQFGNNLTLTPHVYRMNAAATLTDSLNLNAQGNANAVFIIQVIGAFSTGNNSKINLLNGAKASNVFWLVEGATSLGTLSSFKGTIIGNNGSISAGVGSMVEGRLLTTIGAINYSGASSALPTGGGSCGGPIRLNPIAVRDSVRTTKNTQKKIGVLANDSNINYSAFNLSIKTLPLHGGVALTAGGDSVIYTPNTNYLGLDSFFYKICTSTPPLCDSAWAIINVVPLPNRRPIAKNDTATTFKNILKKIAVLKNDSDSDNNVLTINIITQPLNGTAVVISDTISYTPNNNFRGRDSLRYRICDNGIPSLCDSAWVFISIVNRRPIAINDTTSTFKNTQKKIAVLINDTDPDGDPLTASLLSFPANGTVTFLNDTAYYIPNVNFIGIDTFRYKVCDNQVPALCDSALVFVRILQVSQGGGPGSIFVDGNVSTCYALFTGIGNVTNTGVTTIVGDIGSNNGSVSGFTPSLVNGGIHSPPDSSTSHVASDVNAAFNFYDNLTPQVILTPSQFGGNNLFVPRIYQINNSATLLDSIVLSGQNNPDALFVFKINGNLATAIGSKIILRDSAKASNVIFKVDGTTTFGAGTNFKGTIFGHNNITIGTGTDITGRALTTFGTVSLTSAMVHLPRGFGACGAPTYNSAPIAVNDTVVVFKNGNIIIDVLRNDYDPNSDTLTPTIIRGPRHGFATVSNNKNIYYQPTPGYVGLDTIKYRVCDPGNPPLCDSAFIFITVGPNRRPIAVNDTAVTNKNIPVNIDVTSNDFDADRDPFVVSITNPPLHGTAIIVGLIVRYTPASNFTGWDTLRYKICDNGTPIYCDSAFVFINTINNRAPRAVNDSVTTLKNIPVTINVTANDNDPDGDPLTVSIITAPLHGTTTLVGNNVRYMPDNNYLGIDSFYYKICDNGIPSLCDSAKVYVNTVTNRKPVAINDHVTTLKNTAITINVTANDGDPDGNPLTVSIIGTPKHGSVLLVGNNIRYTPDLNYLGIDSFPYKICDNGTPSLCDSAWVYVTTVINRAPDANDDYVSTRRNTQVTINELANDNDPDGDPLTVSIIRGPVNGTSILVGSNIRYTPNSNFGGTDSLLYQICDNGNPSLCDSAWVHINVIDNRSPIALNDFVNVLKNSVANINVTANDSDPDGDPLNVSVRTLPKNGSVILVGNIVRYTPNSNFLGADSLSYNVCDNGTPSLCDFAWVYINVVSNLAPRAVNDTVVTLKNVAITVKVTANDSDPAGLPLTVSIIRAPKNGTATLTNNNVLYTPALGFLGLDSLLYRICNNGTPVMCDSAWVFINVVSNRAPVAINDNVTTKKNTAITVNVIANDFDPDGDVITIGLVAGQGARNGNAIVVNNKVVYTPALNFTGIDSVLYQVCDNGSPSLCATAWVIINVINNRPPVAINDFIQVLKNTPQLVDVTANDIDPDGDPLTVSFILAPKNGSATLVGNVVRYVPNTNYLGQDSLRYKICDNGTPSLCDSAWVYINVVPNRAPIALNDTVTTNINVSIVVNVTANDRDPDGNTISLSSVGLPLHGTAVINGNNVTYTPALNYNGTDTFSYTICDNGTPSLCSTARVYINIIPNRKPVAVNDYATTTRNIPVTVDVTANDTDPDGNTLTVSTVGSARNGNIVLIGKNIRYSPNFNYIGLDSFLYRICDNGTPTLCDSAWVFINVLPNRKPVAVDDYTTTRRNTPVTIDVTANDTDPDGQTLTVSILNTPVNGTVILIGKNIRYTPNFNYLGLDSFPYKICDNGTPILCDTGWVYVNTVLNRAPVAVNDTVTIRRNTSKVINVTANDRDADGDPLTVSIITAPKNGIAVLSGINITYTPNASYIGRDSILYRICDNGSPALCDSAWVIINVVNNSAPVAINDNVTILRNTIANINVTANDFDPEGDPLTVSTITAPKNGTATIVGNMVRYTSATNFVGLDSLSYTVCDNGTPSLCSTAWVYINVVTNRAPIAVDDRTTTTKNVAVTVNVTANDSDPDGNLFSVSLFGSPKHGTVVLVGNNVVYTPSNGFLGMDSFPYKICDNGTPVLCDSAYVFIDVVNNRAPVAVNDDVTTKKNTTIIVDVTLNDFDPDGDPITVSIITATLHGNAFVTGNRISYTPDNNFIGTDSLLYQICDNGNPALCSTAWVIIRTIDNRAPKAVNDYVLVLKNTPQLINVTKNDSDPDGDPLTVTILTTPVNGSNTLIGNIVFYTPNNNYLGLDSFSYRICDNANPSLCDIAWVYINVVSNRAPVAVNDSVTTLKNVALTIDVTANDYDLDGNPLLVSIAISPKKGSVSVSGTNVVYTPNNNFTGLDSFSYRICDNGTPVLCDSAWVYINVLNNRRPIAVNDVVTTFKNFPVTINVTSNDSDPDGDQLSVSIIGVPNHGTIVLIGKNIRYTPNLGFVGVDSLPYKICDNGSPTLCDSAWVYINVITQNGNRPPVAINDQIGICNDGSSITVLVQFNDSDPDGDSLTTGISTGALHGIATLNGNAINYKPNASYSGIDTITYFVCDNNIPSLCATAYVLITVNPIPASISNPDQKVCLGSSIIIGKPLVPGNSYRWSPVTGLSNPLISQTTVTPIANITYTLTETVIATGCQNTSTLNVVVNPLPLAITGPNVNIYNEKSAVLGAPSVTNHTYRWSPSLGLNFTNIAQPIASPSVTTTYALTETDTITGCSKTNAVTVSVENIDFFTGFSPNGDGKNDFWRIPVFEIYNNNQVAIFNRWGNEVWNTVDYNNTSNSFEGKNKNGNDLPDGTYYYIINYNNSEKRGWVVIKR
ncbi:MAG: tandem-95 repeat protein [Bacteroidia bacterium]|nr:tandem-95 repeat protein [Bacteroidia bacterium]